MYLYITKSIQIVRVFLEIIYDHYLCPQLQIFAQNTLRRIFVLHNFVSYVCTNSPCTDFCKELKHDYLYLQFLNIEMLVLYSVTTNVIFTLNETLNVQHDIFRNIRNTFFEISTTLKLNLLQLHADERDTVEGINPKTPALILFFTK